MRSLGLTGAIRRTILGLAVARKGMPDVTALTRLPDIAKMPLQRHGVDPVPALGELRDAEPVTLLTRIMGLDIWLITGYAEAKAVLADSADYSNDMRRLLGNRNRSDAEGIGGLGMTDAPDHTRLRGLLTPEFTVRRLSRLQDSITAIVEDVLDGLERSGEVVDLVHDFGFAIPFRVICDLLGIPEDERGDFQDLSIARFDVSQGGMGAFGAATHSRQFFIDAVGRQRAHPGDGLIGAILTSHGEEFDDVELGGLIDGVFLGGYETSASMLAMGVYVLCREPEAWLRLQTGTRAQVDAIIEELLRYLCPVQLAFARFPRHDVELGGHRIKKGDFVAISLTAANRDPSIAPTPEQFTLDHPATGHLAFGHGMHRCVGAELARMELRAALTGLARRFPDLTLDSDDLTFRELSIVHSIDALPVRLGAAHHGAAAAAVTAPSG